MIKTQATGKKVAIKEIELRNRSCDNGHESLSIGI